MDVDIFDFYKFNDIFFSDKMDVQRLSIQVLYFMMLGKVSKQF